MKSFFAKSTIYAEGMFLAVHNVQGPIIVKHSLFKYFPFNREINFDRNMLTSMMLPDNQTGPGGNPQQSDDTMPTCKYFWGDDYWSKNFIAKFNLNFH